jgi:hypothetical protein
MSITVDYVFNYSGNLAELAALIKESTGCMLSPYEGDSNDLFTRFLGMELSLSKNRFENDGDMNFEDYRFHLSLRTPVGLAALRSLQVPTMAYLAYVLYWWCGLKGMLVFDAQILLAHYEERVNEFACSGLYDTISNEFVSFPFHLNNLKKQVPESAGVEE